MDLIQSYSPTSNSDSDSDSDSETRIIKLPTKSAAPKVDDTALSLISSDPTFSSGSPATPLDPTQHIVSYDPTYDQLWAPIYGPAHPFAKNGLAQGLRNHKLGSVEDAAFASLHFVGDLNSLETNRGVSVHKRRRLLNKREIDEDDANDEDKDNPATDTWLSRNRKSPWAGKKDNVGQEELTEEQKKYAEEHAKKKAEERGEKVEKGEVFEEKSKFHGKEERDYQGRSWIKPPKDKKPDMEQCYIPKRLEHTWIGHTKGVSAIRFFPKFGNLILSAGMDSKVKIWDVYNSRKCMRTYIGHSKAVRDICFSNDGSKFLSAGFDKNIKYWDTETGKVISTFSTGKIPYVVKLNPDDDNQNVLLAGMSDNKIVQWDMNSREITQVYDQHLGAVNTITFVDDNRRFVTSSDDKSLRVWEFGIPVVIKYISEPYMHSMPSIAVHPDNNWLAAQSLDNQILVYSTRDRFQLNKKKRFAGHIAAGYACQVNFSPDGQFVMSGDGEGKMWYWDWKTCKVSRKIKCHEGVCIGCEWHPLETSKVATCGWDGLIKFWD
ncbi:uncharacterized protein LOC141644275 [Silene latifolia]|uniref:uncharacterized protein LOC141644275 n=1 Tax=Silene latifolia TaxID=37657 RepID=UPI003D78846E